MYSRSLKLPDPGTKSFFLWGPRQVGKTTLLRATYPDAFWVDLLSEESANRFASRPDELRIELDELDTPSASHGRQVVIDEIQKVPALLDSVHWLIENRGLRFALCGSSARKLRRGGVNLLGGRAVNRELRGLTAIELDDDFDLTRVLNHGYIPQTYMSDEYEESIEAYVSNYMTQEIIDESVVRNVPIFSDFLDAAALRDGAIVNFSNIARESGVSYQTVKSYYTILEDTLMGRWLPAYSKQPKGTERRSRKFYFSDVGVVNHLARRGVLRPGSAEFGKAFENWVFHELTSYVAYKGIIRDRLSYWQLKNGNEVDFILGSQLAVEAKASTVIAHHHMKSLRLLQKHHPDIQRRAVVSLVPRSQKHDDGILVLTPEDFINRLWQDELFQPA